ncbi:MAG: hypothetical protein WC983_03445 [Tissierellaceae bacterium]
MRKQLIYILMVGLLLSSFNLHYVVGAGVYDDINSEQEFYDYLDLIDKPIENTGYRVANYQVFKKYNVVAYGEPWGDVKDGERRYLGYNETDDPFTNDRFGADNVTGTPPEQFTYIKQHNAPGSWDAVRDESQRFHMINGTMTGNNATQASFTLQWIANKFGGNPEEYGMMLFESTWGKEGKIKLQHKSSSGKVWYITESVPPMVGGALVTGDISTPTDTYTIRSNESQVKIPTTVTARAVTTGSANPQQVRKIEAISLGQGQPASGTSTVSKTTDYVATRANYPPGTHTITLNGSVSLETIFNDRGSQNVSKTVTLVVEPEGDDPFVITEVFPEPSEQKFENEDIEVTLTVNAELRNYTKTDNIKEWIIYAREKEVTTALEKKIYTKTLTPETTFKFTIPEDRIEEDTYKQYYVVRARAYFKEKVNGKEYYDAPAETVVVVYKNKPPTEPKPPKPPASNPPTTKISGPTIVGAGEPARYSARAEAFAGKSIEYAEFWSSVPPYQETTSKIAYSFTKIFTMDDIGPDRLIEHIVEDSAGATASDFLLVEVTPPRPKASLDFDGWLKEKRTVEIIDTSDSYGLPIIPSKTKITITPDAEGATNDVRFIKSYKRDYMGYERKVSEYIFNDGGTYNVEIYVENSIGLSDTRVYNITIEPDIPPIADYSFNNKIYRNKDDGNYASMEITDLSYSADYDKIVERIWTITYNANNNKDDNYFPDYSDDISFQIKDTELLIGEEKVLVKNGFTYKITKLATDKIIIKVNQVGHYLVELKAIEDYGMEGDTGYKHKIEKTITVLNREPFVDFEP